MMDSAGSGKTPPLLKDRQAAHFGRQHRLAVMEPGKSPRNPARFSLACCSLLLYNPALTDAKWKATQLVDQTYLGLVTAKDRDWRNRQHFFAIAGRVMRRQLIDYARQRPGVEFVPLEGMKDLLPAASASLKMEIHCAE